MLKIDQFVDPEGKGDCLTLEEAIDKAEPVYIRANFKGYCNSAVLRSIHLH